MGIVLAERERCSSASAELLPRRGVPIHWMARALAGELSYTRTLLFKIKLDKIYITTLNVLF